MRASPAAAALAFLAACGAPLPPAARTGSAPDGKRSMKHTNRLIHEKSPYLLQHAHNPVDWYPWGSEAFEKARAEDKPIFLSIGYSTCHWCHVMERESFEDEEVARLLNEHFVSIKVDREERPDVDQIYMTAVQAMGQHGGWPLSVWLTPDREPFMGGTYFPKEDRFGRPGFMTVLRRIADLWKDRKGDIRREARQLAEILRRETGAARPGGLDPERALHRAFLQIQQNFEPAYGGFSHAPKFPHGTTIQFLLRYHLRTKSAEALEMAEKTLTEMARGGLYDQLGGGFHRYSTDARWIVPHFEKMLYDQATLAVAYLEAWQATGRPLYERILRETLEYVLRDMTSPEGAFYSAEDADSEGIEGKFYVWNPAQVRQVLGEKDAERFCRAFDVTPEGNWEPFEESIPRHQSVLRLVEDGSFDDLRRRMFEARSRRVRPGRDDKVLTSWNGLMISAFARAAQVLEEPRYREAAARAARFLLARHVREGVLLRTSRLGEAKIEGYLDDHAFLAAALLDLYETTFDAAWLAEARRWADRAAELFGDAQAGGFYVTAAGREDLIARMREDYEGPMPTANATLALVFLRLHHLTGEDALRGRAEKTLASYASALERYPAGHATMLMAADFLVGPVREVVVSEGPGEDALLRAARRPFAPRKVVARAAAGAPPLPLLEGRGPVGGKAAAYVCENRTCRAPVTEPGELEALLRP
ncbi:MAG TPA: thioredoxin domain-containing protein [Planctomycetota bacterium]|nr:thioredoxin domain-containing protein [Planctomycetota bacterium]